MLYGEKGHDHLMDELEKLGKELLSDPKKLQNFLYNAGVVDKNGNFT